MIKMQSILPVSAKVHTINTATTEPHKTLSQVLSLTVVGLCLTGAMTSSAWGQEGQPQRLPFEAKVTLDNQTFKLEVARTSRQQSVGLMFRTQMPEDAGMVFVFEPARPAGFWMRNTLIPLDMLFVHRGKLVDIAQNVPPCKTPQCPTYGPKNAAAPIDQVIELNAGMAGKLRLKPGDRVNVEFLTRQAGQPGQ